MSDTISKSWFITFNNPEKLVLVLGLIVSLHLACIMFIAFLKIVKQ